MGHKGQLAAEAGEVQSCNINIIDLHIASLQLDDPKPFGLIDSWDGNQTPLPEQCLHETTLAGTRSPNNTDLLSWTNFEVNTLEDKR